MAAEQDSSTSQWPRVLANGASLKKAFRTAASWIEAHADEINALNVFPVPDGDTGTNMLLTCQAACEEMNKVGDSIPEVMRAIAHGSLMGARGNSGVILSQILRGVARSIDNKTSLSVADVVAALQEGSATAYKGVIKPVEGTILTVIRETAEAAAQIGQQTDDLAVLLDGLVDAAYQSVERTPSLLPTLRLAGVVDAGGQGLYRLLQGLQRYVRGETSAKPVSAPASLEKTAEPEGGYGYDIQFIINGEHLDLNAIRSTIAGMGESALVVGDEHTIKVHVHAPNPGPVLAYGASQGSLTRVIVENMQEQYVEFRQGTRSSDDPVKTAPQPTQNLVAAQSGGMTQLTGISTVVVATGDGFDKLFRSLDCTCIVPGGQTMNPSTQQILEAIEAAPTDQVIVLPNNKNIIMTAEQARHLTSKSVEVVPTTTLPQGIAALLALNYDADLVTNRRVMEEAAARVVTAEITTAVRASHIDGLDVRKGEIIGLVDDHLVCTGTDVDDVVLCTLAEMGDREFELYTLYYGNGVQKEQAAALAEKVRQAHPQAEVEVIEGGQPHYMYIISAE